MMLVRPNCEVVRCARFPIKQLPPTHAHLQSGAIVQLSQLGEWDAGVVQRGRSRRKEVLQRDGWDGERVH